MKTNTVSKVDVALANLFADFESYRRPISPCATLALGVLAMVSETADKSIGRACERASERGHKELEEVLAKVA